MEFEFRFILEGHFNTEDEKVDELADRLFECGCDDGTFGISRFIGTIDFTREADSLEEAINSAKKNVEAAGCKIKEIIINDGKTD